MSDPRRALVVGATGFVGRWLAHAAEAARWSVTRAARDVRDLPEGITVDATQAVAPELVRGYDVVLNGVGYGVDRSERDEALAEQINVTFVASLAEACAAEGVALAHVGSALEYGEIGGDLVETSVPNPTTLYGTTKLAGTLRLQEIAEREDLRAFTARLFMLYGPGEHEGRLLPSLLAMRDGAEPLDLTAGTQRRDFTYVEDAVDGVLRLVAAEGVAPGEIVNVATGRLTSVRTFVETALDVLGIDAARARFGALPGRREEMAHDPVNVARLEALTAWRPAVTPREGIRRTAALVAPRSG